MNDHIGTAAELCAILRDQGWFRQGERWVAPNGTLWLTEYTMQLSNLQADQWLTIPSGETSTVSGSIDLAGDRDAWLLDAAAGDEIQLYATNALSGTVADLYITVLAPNGNEVATSHSYNAFEMGFTLPAREGS